MLHHVVHHHAHGLRRGHGATKKHVGTTHHGKPGMHKHQTQLPGVARKDAWKHKAQAQGQG